MPTLQEYFGNIDIYLFDQILRGRIAPGMKILDAGCGGGRNLVYLLREGYECFGSDGDQRAIDQIQKVAAALAPTAAASNFRCEAVEKMSFANSFADVVISSAVLHFAQDDDHFTAMLRESWRVLKSSGLFFCRLASSIGIEQQILRILQQVPSRRYQLPDGSDRYLVDEAILMELTKSLGGQLLDPIKTTVVQNQRSMTTWVMRKT